MSLNAIFENRRYIFDILEDGGVLLNTSFTEFAESAVLKFGQRHRRLEDNKVGFGSSMG